MNEDYQEPGNPTIQASEEALSFKLRLSLYWVVIVLFAPVSLLLVSACWIGSGWTAKDTYWKFRPEPADGLRKLREEEKWAYLAKVEAERDALLRSIEEPEALVRRLAKDAISQMDLTGFLIAALPTQNELDEISKKSRAMIDTMVEAMAERFEERIEELEKALAARPVPVAPIAAAPAVVLPSSGATTPATAAARAAAAADVVQQPKRTIDPAFVSSQVVGEDVAAAAMRAIIDPDDIELQRALKRYGDTE